MRLDQITCDISDALNGVVTCNAESHFLGSEVLGVCLAAIAVIVTWHISRKELTAQRDMFAKELAIREQEAKDARLQADGQRVDRDCEQLIEQSHHVLVNGSEWQAKVLAYRMRNLAEFARGLDDQLAESLSEHATKLIEQIDRENASESYLEWRPRQDFFLRLKRIDDVLWQHLSTRDIAAGHARAADIQREVAASEPLTESD
ncbi:hypothetical protein [Aeromicrobium sp. IC_218]|uniref:hypothetical protein n=1 Tax=Aeromicrobium sp. IC_218 TaxID=2545468 RepID=UPI00103C1E41|nr:hypothetical protein [Aeromicrobium sp. IC_218]TCI96402.1 hypothetical protein E0W78_14815 [Aeromicrobium sp. IC_218]